MKIFVFIFTYLTLTIPVSADIIFVDDNAPPSGDGQTWGTAYKFLQDALNDPCLAYGDEIWVAGGIYKPDEDAANPGGTGGRTATFQLINRVAIYGGYAGFGSPDPNARDFELYDTALSGDLNGDDGPDFANNGENSYHVVSSSGMDTTAILDGFTITSGNANGSGPHDDGGGMYNYESSPVVTNCTFSGNWAGIGAGMYNYNSSPTLDNCTFTGNSTGYGGAGIYNFNCSPKITNCIFSSNSARVFGGGMYNINSSPTLTNCTFSGNWSDSDGGGAGMYNYNSSSPLLTNCTFSGNWCDYAGGAGMANHYGSNPMLTNCTFSGNWAAGGGGMYNASASSPVLSDCIFTENWGVGSEQYGFDRGGAIYNAENCNPVLTSCTFSRNAAGYNGGGMYNINSNPTVTNCTFSGNSGGEHGGGMNNYEASPTVTDCTFNGNSADYGSGGMSNWNSSSPTITNCTFNGNSSTHGGGMINYSNCNPTLTNCTFSGNSAIRWGGGMFNYRSSPMVTGCTFSGNSANQQGGGIFNYDYSSPTVTNCVFSENSAALEGGGVYNNRHSSPTVTNCTLRGNSAGEYGGGIYNTSSSVPVLGNCILWGNAAPNGPEIHNDGTSYATVNYSDVQGSWTGEGNIDTDPLFVDPNGADGIIGTEDDNLRLQADSACIDAGDNSVVDANIPDLDGNPRILDGSGDGDAVVDMGAYEFFYANTHPVADAGQDQMVYAGVDGTADIQLDGSGSYDADGDPLEYFWFIGQDQIAIGVDPNVELAIGEHTIELIVDDGTESSEPNAVVITVIEPIEADVYIVPRIINRQGRMKRIIAIMRLPEGISKHDVANEMLELYVGELDVNPVEATWQRINGWGNITRIFALFNKDEVMNAAESNGRIDMTVVGKLETGQYIQGSDTVRIVKPRRRRPHRQAGKRRRWKR